MLKRLKFSVIFPTTGKAFADEHDFESGLTTISGHNEAGKSLRLEFIRYALHGSRALRGTADKYKNLDVELDFAVKGDDYTIVRKPNKQQISRGDAIIAVGTTAVNLKVAELFGYGLDVFDSSHCINQGQIEALGAMLPSERRRMVDRVIGLDVLDGLIKFTSDTALTFVRELEVRERVLAGAPVAPVKPESYQSAALVALEREGLVALKTERDGLRGQLKNVMPEPAPVAACSVVEPVAVLEAMVATRNEAVRSLEMMEALAAGIPDPTYTEAELVIYEKANEQYRDWAAYKRQIDLLPARPTETREALEQALLVLHVHTSWDDARRRFDQHQLTCPSCAHSWAPGFADPGPEPAKPTMMIREIQAQQRAHDLWDKAPSRVIEVPVPMLSSQDIIWQRQALSRVDEKATLLHGISQAVIPVDRSADLAVRRSFDTQRALFDQRWSAWTSYCDLIATVEARLVEIGEIDEALSSVQSSYEAAILYEQDLARYQAAAVKFATDTAEIAVIKAQAEDYKRARAALATLKSMVKAHVVPSLNIVASSLLNQMTGGERTTIKVDEEFDIKIDGQDIEELSGSAKAVGNLAIRLGLGQVLTNRTFGVFMGDELDAAMDVDRAGYTSECLRGLTAKIPQVILVTHKRPEADHYIDLGEAA